jgi:hypothetical protein
MLPRSGLERSDFVAMAHCVMPAKRFLCVRRAAECPVASDL